MIATLYYEDVGAAIEWLCGAFAFREVYRYGPPENPEGCQLKAGGGFVMLSKARTGQSPTWGDSARLAPPARDEHSVILGVHIEDADKHFRQARAGGARIIHEPASYPFGERQYTAEDLAGYRWAFSQTIADVAPEDWGAQLAKD